MTKELTVYELSILYALTLEAFTDGKYDRENAYIMEAIHIVMSGLYMGLIGSTPQEVVKDARELWAVFAAGDYQGTYAVAQRLAAK